MKLLKIALLVLGFMALLLGLIWVGQGTGYFPYPKESFMISQMPWAYRGAGLAVVGLILIVMSRKLRPSQPRSR
ncbi:MAG: hypothetical protein PHT60_00795 [Acidiphilium sp.]|nr:hypothetical protein [Acidiphilium sp.]MDD4934292.1 hypothetical protein [Acidiphilium sp.]